MTTREPLPYCVGCEKLQPVGYCIVRGWVQFLDGEKPSKINPCRWK